VATALLAIAVASRALRGRGFRELIAWRLGVILVAVLVGAIALAIAVPLVGAYDVTVVEWWLIPSAREGGARFAIAIALVIANAIALELALRGWILERMLELSPGPPGLPIFTAALAEALVLPGPLAARIGVLLFGAGLGVLYVGSGRNLAVTLVARCAFALGALLWAAG